MINLIPIAISLAAKFAPDLIGKLAGNKAGVVAEKVVSMAQSITGFSDPQKAHDTLFTNEELGLEYKQDLLDFNLNIYKEDTKRLEAVNTTMVAESKSESWWQSGWRPFNGFSFGITLFMDYIGSQFLILFFKFISPMFEVYQKVDITALSSFSWEHIPWQVYCLWTSVLGVSAGSRGFEKVKQNKLKNENMNLIETISEFGKGMIGK